MDGPERSPEAELKAMRFLLRELDELLSYRDMVVMPTASHDVSTSCGRDGYGTAVIGH